MLKQHGFTINDLINCPTNKHRGNGIILEKVSGGYKLRKILTPAFIRYF